MKVRRGFTRLYKQIEGLRQRRAGCAGDCDESRDKCTPTGSNWIQLDAKCVLIDAPGTSEAGIVTLIC
jgi:hypothetical protein